MENTQEKSVISYYLKTKWDYENLWFGGKDNYSVHFGFYDSKIKNHKDALLNMNREMADRAHITKDDKVIDAGCGYGQSSIWLAKNIGCNVTGLNIVPFQVSEANNKIKEEKIENLVSVQMENYNHTSLPSESATVYWALESLVHSRSHLTAIKEASRLLQKGGRIVIGEYLLRENPELTSEEKSYLEPWLKSWAMPKLLTPHEYKSFLVESGFQDVIITDISKNIYPSLRRLKQLCRNVLPMVKFLSIFYPYNPERVKNLTGSQRQVIGFEKGLWQYSIITARKI